MLNGDAARYRTQDMMRASQTHRAGKAIAKRRAEHRNARVRGALAAVATLISLPIHR